jgi:segregation and condensation protein A
VIAETELAGGECCFDFGDPIRVGAAVLTELPIDLYIPPDALKVFLEAFEGPLDLLLYLIRKHNIDILDIPIAEVTRQYMIYVEIMKEVHLELAADYLVMAATLAEIKSRLLLPRPATDSEEEVDPRAELIRRLQEYERFKSAAHTLNQMPQVGRDIWIARALVPEQPIKPQPPEVSIEDLLAAFVDILNRGDLKTSHLVQKEALSVRERMGIILDRLRDQEFLPFESFFYAVEGRRGVVVTFLAILELLKENLLQLVQAEDFGPIHIKVVVCESNEL